MKIKRHGGRLMTIQGAQTGRRALAPRHMIETHPVAVRPPAPRMAPDLHSVAPSDRILNRIVDRAARARGGPEGGGDAWRQGRLDRQQRERSRAPPTRSMLVRSAHRPARVDYGFGPWLPENAPSNPCIAAGAFMIFVPLGTTNRFGS
jgi:hypothetical protein